MHSALYTDRSNVKNCHAPTRETVQLCEALFINVFSFVFSFRNYFSKTKCQDCSLYQGGGGNKIKKSIADDGATAYVHDFCLAKTLLTLPLGLGTGEDERDSKMIKPKEH